MTKWLLTAVVLGGALTGCLIVGPPVSGGALLFSGEIAASDDSRVFVVPEGHYGGLRFEASAYPIDVYRVVLVYRNGGEQSHAVNWRFEGRTRYRDLRIPRDRDVREVRMYYRPLPGPPARGDHGRGDGERQGPPRGRATISVFGVR